MNGAGRLGIAVRPGDQPDLVLLPRVGEEEGPRVSVRRSNHRLTADNHTAYAAVGREQGGTRADAPAGEKAMSFELPTTHSLATTPRSGAVSFRCSQRTQEIVRSVCEVL